MRDILYFSTDFRCPKRLRSQYKRYRAMDRKRKLEFCDIALELEEKIPQLSKTGAFELVYALADFMVEVGTEKWKRKNRQS